MRFGVNDVDNYGGNGGSSFFSLKNDGDVARVRFLYNTMEDVVGYAVHQITIDGKSRYVNCLRSYNDPKSKCPFCEANNFQRAKLYIPLYDIDEGEVKVWERGKNFFQKMSAICARYSNATTPLVSHTFDIERHGKKGDTSTVYEVYETGVDETTLEDLPEVPEVLGSIILDKSEEEMREFLDTGSFPTGDVSNRRESKSDNQPTGRRTPSRRSEAF